jgi:hypothetical protein
MECALRVLALHERSLLASDVRRTIGIRVFVLTLVVQEGEFIGE